MSQQHRIVSLIPSATEIVHALGGGSWLVGRSHECDYPAEVVELPACSSAKFDVLGNSREIDDRVKATLLSATSVYEVDARLLNHLEPTVILTQTMCELCAVSLKDVQAAVCEVVSSQPLVLPLESNSLSDLWRDILKVGTALNLESRSANLVLKLRTCLESMSHRALELPYERPTVACVEWIEPLMAAGNWIPELVSLTGGENLFGKAGEHSPWMSWDDLRAADPDVIVIMPCGFDIPRTLSEMHWLTERPEWSQLKAVRNDRVAITDGNQYFNRPGPRLLESAEILAEIFYPVEFDYGHRGVGWVPWTATISCQSH